MRNTNISTTKKTGATFTPPQLADFLSKKIISYCGDLSQKIILDPACGDGALLLSIAKQANFKYAKIKGYDTNADYVKQTYDNLKKIGISEVEIEQKDFLEISSNKIDLFSSTIVVEDADIVIANPPYVRTQILGTEKSQQIAKSFNLKGKIDLYFAFLIGITNVLKKDGILGVITSNRYLTTKSGAEIRKFLLDNYDVLEVIDLGDSQLFDAAVLPAIFIGRKKRTKNQLQSSCKFAKLYESVNNNENAENVTSIYDIFVNETSGIYKIGNKFFNLSTGILSHSSDKTDIWTMMDENDNKFVNLIKKNTFCLVGDKLKVRVGIKSCADNVFIKDNWANEKIAENEQDLFRPMISRENITRWNCSVSNLTKILYPHYEKEGIRRVYDIDKYPTVKQYLLKYKQQLESRAYLISSGRKWYEMWVPQNPGLWSLPKLVFPDISIEAQFSYDESGSIVNGNCYWIVAQTEQEKELLLLIQGVANSDLMSKYHDLCFNNKLYSGRRRYLSQYIEKYPIPDPNSKFSEKIIELTKRLNSIKEPHKQHSLIKELNKNVNLAFGVTD